MLKLDDQNEIKDFEIVNVRVNDNVDGLSDNDYFEEDDSDDESDNENDDDDSSYWTQLIHFDRSANPINELMQSTREFMASIDIA